MHPLFKSLALCVMQFGGELLIKKALLTFHFTILPFYQLCMSMCVCGEASQINIVWCNKSQHEHPDVSANIFVRKKTPFLWNSIIHNAHVGTYPKKVSLECVCVWKDPILSTFTATMRFIMADNILEVFMDQLSGVDHEVKYLHTAAFHLYTRVALLTVYIYFSYFSTYLILFWSWNFFQIMTNTRINLSIKMYRSFSFLKQPQIYDDKAIFSSQSLILTHSLPFWWEQEYHFDLCSKLFHLNVHLFIWGTHLRWWWG